MDRCLSSITDLDNVIFTQSIIHLRTERMGGNTLSKYKNVDVNEYDEEYKDIARAFLHCVHCQYKTNCISELKDHMDIDHTEDEREPLAEVESVHGEELINAIEVWKIYKFLQRLKSK